MKPPDLAVIVLLVQALSLGHGAAQVFFEPHRPRYAFWLPLALIVAYFVFAAFVQPTVLDRSVKVTPLVWLHALRFSVQIAGFCVLTETLLYIMRKQRAQLSEVAALKKGRLL